jgi:hypothetical protein
MHGDVHGDHPAEKACAKYQRFRGSLTSADKPAEALPFALYI